MKKRLLAIVLAMTVVFAYSAVGAFAESDAPNGSANDAKLVKFLKKGSGVANPNATFTFKIVKNTNAVAPNNATHMAKAADYPEGDITKSIAASDMVAAGLEGDTKGEISVAKIFEGKTFGAAGIYAFTVTEEEGGFTEDSDAKTTETMNFSKQSFTMFVYVKNTDDGTAIDNVTVENKEGEKVNPTDVDPEPSDPSERDDKDYTADGFTFTNSYTVTTNDDPDNPIDPVNPPVDPEGKYAGFGVSKAVAGEYASKTDEFEFQVTITKPAGFDGLTGKYIAGGSEKTFTYGEAFTVKLKHGQNFGVTEMALGSTVAVKEAGAENYTPAVTGLISKNGTLGQECGDSVVVGTANKGKVAAFVNTMDDENAPTPTGIFLNNLPYILLILIAVAGIAVFTRKRRYE